MKKVNDFYIQDEDTFFQYQCDRGNFHNYFSLQYKNFKSKYIINSKCIRYWRALNLSIWIKLNHDEKNLTMYIA